MKQNQQEYQWKNESLTTTENECIRLQSEQSNNVNENERTEIESEPTKNNQSTINKTNNNRMEQQQVECTQQQWNARRTIVDHGIRQI